MAQTAVSRRKDSHFVMRLETDDREWLAKVALEEDRSAAGVVRRLIAKARADERETEQAAA